MNSFMTKRITLESSKACDCVGAIGQVHSVHTQTLIDRNDLVWEPNHVDGSSYKMLIMVRPMVACLVCGTPWHIEVTIDDVLDL
jgi:hypothetical protein